MTEQRTITLYDEAARRVMARVPVTEDVYRAYWQETEHARYLDKRAWAREQSVQALANEALSAEDALAYFANKRATPEDARIPALRAALARLDSDTREALWQLALGETTERALAERWGVSKSTVHKRKNQAFAKLRQWMAESA